MSPSISIRTFIERPPAPPAEPTSTLVLTSSQHRFVDLRVLKGDSGEETVANIGDSEDPSLPLERLDWAFAGTSSSTWLAASPERIALTEEEVRRYRPFASDDEVPSGPDDKLLRTVWTHLVDSSTASAEEVRDEGDMIPAPSLGLTIEKDPKREPAKGDPGAYVEGWREEEVLPTGVGDLSGEARRGQRFCVVLEMELADDRARGMVVRVGQYCQGLMRVGDDISLARWSWDREHEWKAVMKVGDSEFPIDVAVRDGGWKLGQEITVRTGSGRDFVWNVTETEGF